MAQQPKRPPLSAESFRDHAERLRRKGATRVQVVDGDVCFEVEYATKEPATELQPAIGFMLDQPIEYED